MSTLKDALDEGYEILAGPFRASEEDMMLRVLDDLDKTPSIHHRCADEKGKWYVLRKGMLVVPPDIEDDDIPAGEPLPRRRLHSPVTLNIIAAAQRRADIEYRGILALAIEEAVIARYAPNDDALKIEFRRSTKQLLTRHKRHGTGRNGRKSPPLG